MYKSKISRLYSKNEIAIGFDYTVFISFAHSPRSLLSWLHLLSEQLAVIETGRTHRHARGDLVLLRLWRSPLSHRPHTRPLRPRQLGTAPLFQVDYQVGQQIARRLRLTEEL